MMDDLTDRVQNQPFDTTVRIERGVAGIGPLGTLPPGTRLLDQYVILSTIHPHETQRSGLFLCECDTGKVVVKVAATKFPPHKDLWSRLTDLRHPNVLQTLSTIERDGFYYEIQEYCRGGTLAELQVPPDKRADWIERLLIPRMNEALQYLHSHEIVHRDVKPANIYFRNPDQSELVLGDFDISSVLEEGQTSRDTSRADATWRYSAPEALPLYQAALGITALVSPPADYYALGVTILEVLLGTPCLPGEQAELFRFYTSGKQIALPVEPARLTPILGGLLIRERTKRWGSDQVERWLRRENTKEDLELIEADRQNKAGIRLLRNPYQLASHSASDLKELAKAMLLEPDLAKDDLLKSDRLTNWIQQEDTNVARLVDDSREKYRSEPDVALYRAVLHCDPTYGFPVGREVVHSPIAWLKLLSKSGKSLEATSDVEMKKLEAWFQIGNQLRPDLAKVAHEVRQTKQETRFEELAYAIDPVLPYDPFSPIENNILSDKKSGAKTPAEVAAVIFGQPSDWTTGIPTSFTNAMARYKAGSMEAWLRRRDQSQLAEQARNAARMMPNDDTRFDIFLRHLAPNTPKPEVTFETSSFGVLSTPSGSNLSRCISYTTTGVGVPCGAIELANSPNGLRLANMNIHGRNGSVLVELEANQDVSGGSSIQSATIRLLNGNFAIRNQVAVIQYQVTRPNQEMAIRVMVGTVTGGLLFGGTRYILTFMFPKAIGFNDLTADSLWNSTTNWKLADGGIYILGAVLFLAALVCGFYLWLEALKRSRT